MMRRLRIFLFFVENSYRLCYSSIVRHAFVQLAGRVDILPANTKYKECIDMKKITAFYLTGCPYCANARQALQDLIAENPEYGKVEIDWIEETQNPDLVAGHQYYYDPSMFDGFHKLYEAQPGESFEETKANVRRVLDYALKY